MQSVKSRGRSKVHRPPGLSGFDSLSSFDLTDPTEEHALGDPVKRKAEREQSPPRKRLRLEDPDDNVVDTMDGLEEDTVDTPMASEPFVGPKIGPISREALGIVPTKGTRRRSTPLLRPRRENGNDAFLQGNVEQPIRQLVPATRPDQVMPMDMDEQIRGVPDQKPSKPQKVPVEKMSRIKGMDAVLKPFGLSGGKQGGKYPQAHLHESPEYADYTHARPLQMLSDFADVFLAGATAEGKDPVEIQFGYGLNDVEPDLYASSNNVDSEDWLAGALADPMKYLRQAALGDDPNLQAIAAKLLLYDEQVSQRKAQVMSSDAPNQQELLDEIDLSSRIRSKILSGRTDVAYNKLGGQLGARHAEQNIADVLHDKGYAKGEIGGTKIRCEACTSELGPAMLDDQGRWSMGKFYGAQATKERHQHTWGLLESGQAKVSQNMVSRPRSNSDVAAFKTNK